MDPDVMMSSRCAAVEPVTAEGDGEAGRDDADDVNGAGPASQPSAVEPTAASKSSRRDMC
jgi:hypothetical protein